MNFKDTFAYGVGDLGALGPYDTTNVSTGINIAIAGTLTSVCAAILSKDVVNPDVEARANVAFFRERFSEAISSVTPGNPTVITLANPHGKSFPTLTSAWSFLEVTGVTITVGPDINGITYARLTGTNTIELDFDSTGGSYTGGTVNDLGMGFHLQARMNTDVNTTLYAPTRGYFAQLVWDLAGARKLNIRKYDQGSEVLLTAQGVSVEVASVDVTSLSNKDSSGSDFKITQDLRLIVSDDDRRFGSVRIKAYLNELDDEKPTIDIVDLGQETTSPPVSTSSSSIPGAGPFGWQLLSQEIGLNLFEVSDFAVESSRAMQATGVTMTLEEIADKVKLRLERSTSSSFPDTLYQEWVKEAQWEIVNELGMMCMFLRNRDVYELGAADETINGGVNRYILPKEIRYVESVKSLNTQQEMNWDFVHQDKNGRQVIDIRVDDRGSGPWDITYIAWPERLESITDNVSIPKEWSNVLIQLAIVKGAQYHSDGKLEASARGEYSRLYAILSQTQHRLHQQTIHSKFSGPRGRVSNRYVPAWQRWGSF